MLASKMKLFVNMMFYGSIQVFSEVYALAEATGYPVDKLHEVFGTSSQNGQCMQMAKTDLQKPLFQPHPS
jgi:3-hydroxyisobutyrate dehydrogenase-like beta-hydroxyacid dehydrogenase